MLIDIVYNAYVLLILLYNYYYSDIEIYPKIFLLFRKSNEKRGMRFYSIFTIDFKALRRKNALHDSHVTVNKVMN